MTLDPRPSDNELLRRAAAQAAAHGGIRHGIAPVVLSDSKKIEELAVENVPANRHLQRLGVYTVSLTCTRFRGALIELSGIVNGAPRTKKGHTQNYYKQSLGYQRFRDGVIDGMMGKAAFPPLELNLAAQFYCDNEASDLCNLLQGFCDALENAAVVPNDRYIMAFDGTRQHFDRAHPRIEFRLSPL